MQKEKTVFLEGKTFLIKKFSPEVACYWAQKLMGKFLISATTDDLAEMQDSKAAVSKISAFIENFILMDKKQQGEFQRDALSFVYVVGGVTEAFPLVSRQGQITDPDIGAPTLLLLTIQSFVFSMLDFFAPAQLEGMLGALGLSSTPNETGSGISS